MSSYRPARTLGIALLLALIAACGGKPAAALHGPEEKLLNIYNWVEYIDPSIIPGFERETGIKVRYDVFESNEMLETKLLSGRTGYDLIVPSASFLQRQIAAGVILKLDKSKLPNLANEDPEVLQRLQALAPVSDYGVVYFWGYSGIGYNAARIQERMPEAPLDSFRMFFDPAVVSRFKDCGVSMIEAPDEIYGDVLIYLGRDPNVESEENLRLVADVLEKVRPYFRNIESGKYIADLANGEICLALGWNGDIGQARRRARESGTGNEVRFQAAREGAIRYLDMMAIPIDAAHPDNAHRFIDYMLRPEISARNSSTMRFPMTNAKAYPLIIPEVRDDEGIYPSPQAKSRMIINAARSPQFTRELSALWTRFKTGH